MPKKLTPAKAAAKPARGVTPLLAEVRGLILAAREQVARAVDSGLVTLYWHIGRRVHQDILKEKRAEYGAKIVSALGTQLSRELAAGSTRETSSAWCASPRFSRTNELCPHCGHNWAGRISG